MSDTRWEYRFYAPEEKWGSRWWKVEQLNALGAEGWEAVGIAGGNLLLKRPLSQAPTPEAPHG